MAYGDSWPYGAHCNGCRTFVKLYADGLARTTTHQINFVNGTTNGGTAFSLLNNLRKFASIRSEVASADIIVIATGGNDLVPAFDSYVAGTCGGIDHLDCFREEAKDLTTSFEGILSSRLQWM